MSKANNQQLSAKDMMQQFMNLQQIQMKQMMMMNQTPPVIDLKLSLNSPRF